MESPTIVGGSRVDTQQLAYSAVLQKTNEVAKENPASYDRKDHEGQPYKGQECSKQIPVLSGQPRGTTNNRGKRDNRPDVNCDFSFKGVVRNRNRTERYYVGYIDPGSSEAGIRQFLQDQDIQVTHMHLMKSRRDSTLSAQVNVVASDHSGMLLDRHFWPQGIRCRLWKSASQWYTTD